LNKPVQSFDERIKAKFSHVERERDDMHAYQVEDVQFFKDNPFTFGLIDLGLGKTVTAGTLLADLLSDFMPGKVLVIVFRKPQLVFVQHTTSHLRQFLR